MYKGICLFFLLLPLSIISQNKPEYFRATAEINESTPLWALEMYSDDPNIFLVDQLYRLYYAENTFTKNIHTQNFKQWKRATETIINDEGFIRAPEKKEVEDRRAYFREKRNSEVQRSSNMPWTNIGPVETYSNGTLTPLSNHSNIYSIDVSLTNSNILIAGTESGGVFKSINKALDWTEMTADEDFSGGITAVKIHPTDNDRYLVGANNRIYETQNGGTTWTELINTGAASFNFIYQPGNSNHVWAIGNYGVYESFDGGVNWNLRFSETAWDLEYHATDNSILFILKTHPTEERSEFFRSLDGGASFDNIINGWYMPEVLSEAVENGGKITTSIDDPNVVYACLIGSSKAGDSGWIGLYKSTNSGQTWSLPSGQIGGPYQSPNIMPWNVAAYSDGYHQGYYNFDCVASPTDADKVWIGTIRLTETSDGGQTFTSIGAANSQRLSQIHADLQDIEIVGNDIWIASDGGLNLSTDDLMSHESRKKGITAADFWGFGSGWNHDVLCGGKYHNGNSVYFQNYTDGYFHNVGGVEEATGYVNPFTERKMYFNRYWASNMYTQIAGENLGDPVENVPAATLVPNEAYTQSYSSGYFFHPNYGDHIYAGQGSTMQKSTDGGLSWEILHDFGSNGKVLSIEISRDNPETIYCVFQPNGGYWDWVELQKSTDGGATFTPLTNVPTNNRWRLEFSLDPENDQHIWVSANSGQNGDKIFESLDGGLTWINRTTATLNDEAIADIFCLGGPDNVVYLASRRNIYYKENNNDWQLYSAGLPFIVPTLKMAPFFKDSKLRLATYGRGIFEAPLVGQMPIVAEPMALSDSVYCSKDTVLLDSYSIIDQNGATWNWVINPAPAFMDDANIRNPKVVFGNNGSYDITLSVQSADGISDSKTVMDMITVEDYCQVDTIPGRLMETISSGDYANIPNLGLTAVTEFSMMAWIKPNRIQDEYSSIVMNDGDAAGLNFGPNDNTLQYHWPGGQWWWDSNLEVPVGEWSHVALVAEPTGVTIYLNGVLSKHTVNLNPVDIGTMKINSYKGWGSRNIDGQVDEVSLWTKALTQQQVRLLRHLTLDQYTGQDADLLCYYQFNEPSGPAIDKANGYNAVFSGNAVRDESTVSVGSGTSFLHDISSAGTYTFTGTECDLVYVNGTLPNDEVVISRLHILPHDAPDNNENLSGYWIINNYGDPVATGFKGLNLNDAYSNPSAQAVGATSSLSVLRRGENEYMNWASVCSPIVVSGTSNSDDYVTNVACGILPEGQYFINKSCVNDLNISVEYSSNNVDHVQVIDNIQANNVLEAVSNIIYEAGTTICLDQDFEVQAGAVFEAKIGDCNY